MIPVIIADEIKKTIIDYLQTSFAFQDEAVGEALTAFLTDPNGGIFKGPYLSLKLPFRRAAEDEPMPLTIPPPFAPFVHQMRAFQRLSSQSHEPSPTLVVTGTGSGKTECFLYPILDHCYRHRGQPGVKAVILYPMNALANDQAKRLARVIHDDERLRDTVTAGMYVGDKAATIHRVMGPEHLVDDREILRQFPPDILLTNYKMLDFMLLRPEDQGLWRSNTPETLRYLVLDELHTYDGAQGSDVACLIRRLKAKVKAPPGVVCPIGTSATVAGEEGDTVALLTEFAGQIFGEHFTRASVIFEDRLELEEFVPLETQRDELPTDLDALSLHDGDSLASYVRRQAQQWFGMDEADPEALGEALLGHGALRRLLASLGGRLLTREELDEGLCKRDPELAQLPPEARQTVTMSVLAMIAAARKREGGRLVPLLTSHSQTWVREMSRLLREVGSEARFFWADTGPEIDEDADKTPVGLPAYYCEECGHSGWLSYRRPQDDHLHANLKSVYEGYFARRSTVRYVHPGRRLGVIAGSQDRLCPYCLRVTRDNACDQCHGETFAIVEHIALSEGDDPKDLRQCPECEVSNSLRIVGRGAASLSAVAISHLYTSRFNQDKKLLAFLDSVQDASHRSGFFGARTYRFNLRTAVQRTLTYADPLPLADFAGKMLECWSSSFGPNPDALPPPNLVAAFFPPDLIDHPGYRAYMADPEGDIPDVLRRDLHSRLSWEVCMEYGYNARVGRTLEKVGCSAAAVRGELLDQAVEQLLHVLPEQIGGLAHLTPGMARHFVEGLLTRTRVRGGICHPMLEPYAREMGRLYELYRQRQPLISYFGRDSRLPRFLTDESRPDVFDTFVTGQQTNWYSDWAQRALALPPDAQVTNDLYRHTCRLLTDAKLLVQYTRGGRSVWGLSPGAIEVTARVTTLKCRDCGATACLPAARAHQWMGETCMTYRCPGRYAFATGEEQSYYRSVYLSGAVQRIFTHEHTGLLGRATREEVEEAFSTGNRPDAPNLLTCTPTLEMGIDIGDLSAVMACSVPPTTANYLQRIGRAGRASGNANVLVMATTSPHDLYFFEQPLEMMAGPVEPPGCFLDAPDMLERQYMAYSMDTWAAGPGAETRLPNRVQYMLARAPGGGYPTDFLQYQEAQRDELLEHFLALFPTDLRLETRDRISSFALSARPRALVRRALREVEAERTRLRKLRDRLRDRIAKIYQDPSLYTDPQTLKADLEEDRYLLLRLIHRIDNEYPLNLFTDEGIIPNYAFPESGVTLEAFIYGLKSSPAQEAGEPGKRPGTEAYKWVRPASQAISELAPFNTFYAEGRHVQIDQLETGGREQRSDEDWHFCPECAYCRLEPDVTNHGNCPACGCSGWADVGQIRKALPMRTVAARQPVAGSRVDESQEERESERYELLDLIAIQQENYGGGFANPDVPFGYEYLSEVTLRQFNFGLRGSGGQQFRVAGQTVSEMGFIVCPDCGKVFKDQHKWARDAQEGGKAHRTYCRHLQGQESEPWDLNLYRELTSEAMRVLLPPIGSDADKRLPTFKACLELALRRQFRGRPNHIIIREYRDPIGQGLQRQYLVLFDTVPGGTGYLKSLVTTQDFVRALELAAGTLRSCSCRYRPGADGCYRCLYKYGNSREAGLVSRRLGLEMLQHILDGAAGMVEVPALGELSNDYPFESELEQRFVAALHQRTDSLPGTQWDMALHNGKPCHRVKIARRAWVIEQQVNLDAEQEIAVASRADFVLWPIDDLDGTLPVAVYTDGYEYHVKPGESDGMVADDVRKRAAVIRSGEFVVWSVTWQDVVGSGKTSPTAQSGEMRTQIADKAELALKQMDSPLPPGLVRLDAVDSLIEYLQVPTRSAWRSAAAATAVAIVSSQPYRVPDSAWAEDAAEALLAEGTPQVEPPASGGDGWGVALLAAGDLHVLSFASLLALQTLAHAEITVVLRLLDTPERRNEETFREAWQTYWSLLNVLQFLPALAFTTTEALERYGPLTVPKTGTGAAAYATVSQATPPELELCESRCRSMALALTVDGYAVPVVGYELVDDRGSVVGEAELAWPGQKVAVLVEPQLPYADRFVQAEWTALSVVDLDRTYVRALIGGEQTT